jgi:hypothetical protein
MYEYNNTLHIPDKWKGAETDFAWFGFRPVLKIDFRFLDIQNGENIDIFLFFSSPHAWCLSFVLYVQK